jgi:competence protein ComEC
MGKLHHIYIWKKAPFIRLLPPLVLGILAGYLFNPSSHLIISSVSLIFASVLAFEFLNYSLKFKWRWISGIFLMVLLCFAGMLLLKLNNIKESKFWYGHHLQNADGLQIVLKSKPLPRNKTYKVVAEIRNVISGDAVVSTNGKALFFLHKDSNTAVLSGGDVIWVKNKLRPIRHSGNPGSFDYERYMSFQNIFHQSLIGKDDWESTGKSERNILDQAIESSLDHSHKTFDKYLKGGQETALAKALLTGDRSDLDPELVQAYSNTGVVHIMAISGLHLGLIYILLFRICSVIPVIQNKKWLKFILILLGIWFFAVMTGSSPSVLRSAIMLSFLALSILQKRKISSYNFWAVAAFILLCLDPLLLFNVGFQLSFSAVLGILVAQRPIYHWFHFDNKMVNYVWEMISVTIAAQLFTLPMCLYYFHQFPVLFILSNLIAIPLATVGLWLGVILVMMAWIPAVAKIIGMLTYTAFRWMNHYIQYMNSFDFAVWQSGWLNVFETISLGLIVIFLIAWLMYKRSIYLKLSLTAAIGISSSAGLYHLETTSQRRVTFYNIPNTTIIDFISGHEYFSEMYLTDSIVPDFSNAHIENGRSLFKAKRKQNIINRIPVGKNELLLGKGSFLHIKNEQLFPARDKKTKLNAIILSGSPNVKIADLSKTFDADLYVFTNSNKPYLIERWKKECEELHLHSHDITNEGALVLNY